MKYVLLLSLVYVVSGVPLSYLKKRQAFINEELSMRVGANLTLDRKEQLVNEFLMDHKQGRVNESTHTTKPYFAAEHFFNAKADIDNSTIFDIIKMMPKGGVLHTHSHAMVSLNWVVKTVLYLPNAYYKTLDDPYHTKVFQVFEQEPNDPEWAKVNDLRASANDVDQFDHELEYGMSIWVDDPYTAYPTVNDVWNKFNTYFMAMDGLSNSLELETMYVKQAIKEFYEDGVQYIEVRSGIPKDAKGNDFADDYYQMIKDATKEFQADHPDFIGIKTIIAGKRTDTLQKNRQRIQRALDLMEKFPDLVKGFDLVSQEDVGHTTYYYIDDLLENNRSVTPYFFHAGETDWTDRADLNLVDSVLLNATRIGHGFAALRHPKVLGLVNDLRDHPGTILISENAPVIVSSDDPPIWMAKPLSHDFYYAFMGLGSTTDDLRLLKQLALNSFEFSTMSPEEHEIAVKKWEGRWQQFIEDVIAKYSL